MSRLIKSGLALIGGFSLGMYDRQNRTVLIFFKNQRDLQDKVAKAEELVVDEFKNVQDRFITNNKSLSNMVDDFENTDWGKRAKKLYDTAKQQWSEAAALGITIEEYARRSRDKFENSQWGQQALDEYNDTMKNWKQDKGGSDDSGSNQVKRSFYDLRHEFEKSDEGKKAKEALEHARLTWAAEKLNIEATGHKIWDDRRVQDEKDNDRYDRIDNKDNNRTVDNKDINIGNRVNKIWETTKNKVKDISDDLTDQGQNNAEINKARRGLDQGNLISPLNKDNPDDPVVLRKHERPDKPVETFDEMGVSTHNRTSSKVPNKDTGDVNTADSYQKDKPESNGMLEQGNEQLSKMIYGDSETRSKNSPSSYKDRMHTHGDDEDTDITGIWQQMKDYIGSTVQAINLSQPIESTKDVVTEKVDNLMNEDMNKGSYSSDYENNNKRQQNTDNKIPQKHPADNQNEELGLWDKTKNTVSGIKQNITESRPMKYMADTMEEKMENLHNPSHTPKFDIENANIQNDRRNEVDEDKGVWDKAKNAANTVRQNVTESRPMKYVADTLEESKDNFMNPEHKPKQESNEDSGLMKKAKDMVDTTKDKVGELLGATKEIKSRNISTDKTNDSTTDQTTKNKIDENDKKTDHKKLTPNTQSKDTKTDLYSDNEDKKVKSNHIDIDHHAWTPGSEKQAKLFSKESADEKSGVNNEQREHNRQNDIHVADKETSNLVPVDDSKDDKIGNLAYNQPDREQRNKERAELMARNAEEKAPYNIDARYITVKEKPIPRANTIKDDRSGARDTLIPTIDPKNYELDKMSNSHGDLKNANIDNQKKAYVPKDPVKHAKGTNNSQNTAQDDNKSTDRSAKLSEEKLKPKIAK